MRRESGRALGSAARRESEHSETTDLAVNEQNRASLHICFLLLTFSLSTPSTMSRFGTIAENGEEVLRVSTVVSETISGLVRAKKNVFSVDNVLVTR